MSKSYRIKYDINNPVDHLKVKIEQDFDFLEVLSLKIGQEDVYKLYTSDYGIVVGRVLANDGFGIPNARVSIFIKNQNVDLSKDKNIIYPYTSVNSINSSNIRYNLLPSQKVSVCHQNVGTFPSKRNLLDNNIYIDVFEEYFKYTTTTNESGDYMFLNVPVGSQQIHVDIDLSDIGVLSQAPRDMEYKGYGVKQFDSPNKFKKSTNLDSLPQIITENTSVFVYPFWGDVNQGEIAISKKNINLQYKFEPTCVFMGSIFTDSTKGGINKTCTPNKSTGVMGELTTSQGSIEMIRETITGDIENFSISGDRLINNDGVWCYQIPMNLDYVITDEFGNIIPANDPSKGIPTRTNVRFRITLDDNGDSFVQNKTASYLVPNNPKGLSEEDYQFNSGCKPTSFINLMWNKVYSVKNYIPRVQKDNGRALYKSRLFSGLKSINYYGQNNPAPYNNIWVNINLRFMLMCLLTNFAILIVGILNGILNSIYSLSAGLVKIPYVALDSNIGGDNCTFLDGYTYFVPIRTQEIRRELFDKTRADFGTSILFENTSYNVSSEVQSCVETKLSGEDAVVNFDFTNDWVNGSLYAPRYLTKNKKNRKTGKINSEYCGSKSEHGYNHLYLVQTCAVSINKTGDFSELENTECYEKSNCYEQYSKIKISKGVIINEGVNSPFYYRSTEFPGASSYVKYIQPTGVILLGSFNDCDLDGIPQLHQLLPQTSFKLPPDSFEPDYDVNQSAGEDSPRTDKQTSGIDWGNKVTHKENGLFVAVSCIDSDTIMKTCVNASRLCEVGVDFDEKYTGYTGNIVETKYIDGYISNDEITDGDVRGMFATLNGNGLKTKLDSSSQIKYDFTYSFPNSFDGRLKISGYTNSIPGGLETDYTYDSDSRRDYYKFRFGLSNYSDTGLNYGTYAFPRYENSFYFHFGLKPGLTALDMFNNQYFVPCGGDEVPNLGTGIIKIITAQVTDITEIIATGGGFIVDNGGFKVLTKGVCWSTNQNPTIFDSKSSGYGSGNSYICNIENFGLNNTYYVRAFIETNNGVITYGDEVYFVSYGKPEIHMIVFQKPGDQTKTIVEFNGLHDGGTDITEQGIVYGNTQYPSIEEHQVLVNVNPYDLNLEISTPGDTGDSFNFRAYAKNSYGYVYSEVEILTVNLVEPTAPILVNWFEDYDYLTQTSVQGILGSEANVEVKFKVLEDGGSEITSYGVNFGLTGVTHENLTNVNIVGKSDTDIYTVPIIFPQGSKMYQIQGYARNAIGETTIVGVGGNNLIRYVGVTSYDLNIEADYTDTNGEVMTNGVIEPYYILLNSMTNYEKPLTQDFDIRFKVNGVIINKSIQLSTDNWEVNYDTLSGVISNYYIFLIPYNAIQYLNGIHYFGTHEGVDILPEQILSISISQLALNFGNYTHITFTQNFINEKLSSKITDVYNECGTYCTISVELVGYLFSDINGVVLRINNVVYANEHMQKNGDSTGKLMDVIVLDGNGDILSLQNGTYNFGLVISHNTDVIETTAEFPFTITNC